MDARGVSMGHFNKSKRCCIGYSMVLVVFFAMVLLEACLAGKPATPGLCTVNCRNAVFSSPYARIAPLDGAEDYTLACKAAFSKDVTSISMARAITIRFKITEPPPKGATHQDWDEPRPGITFEPVVNGILDPDRSSAENVSLVETEKDDGTKTTEYFPSRYIGIVTPKSQWCTDSCGVGNIEVWPMCVQGIENQITFSAHSGATSMETPMKFTVANDDEVSTDTSTSIYLTDPEEEN